MTRGLERHVRQMIREKLGYSPKVIEAYVIGAYSADPEEDCNWGCDAKETLCKVVVRAGDRLDCYLYEVIDGELNLCENVEVHFGVENDSLVVTRVLTTLEVIQFNEQVALTDELVDEELQERMDRISADMEAEEQSNTRGDWQR